jgi:predicted homoserine dehydrogenase-like protein
MMGVDKLLAERAVQGDPVRVAIAGCGFMGRFLVNQVVNSVPGMTLAAIAARNPDNAFKALIDAGVGDGIAAEGAPALKRAIRQGVTAVTEDFRAITQTDGIDVVIDVTGAVEFGCHLALDCFAGGKHLVLMNAALDATVGAELGRLADAAGVVLTGCDGDQPGAQMNLIRFVRSIGITPLVSGNIKGLHDRYRNPTTQEGFARRWGQDPWMVTRFADGTKISVEQSIVANATGMSLHKRGMLGRSHGGHVDQLTHCYDIDELRALGGAVDYVVHAKPNRGVYCFGIQDDPKQQHYLELYQLGTGRRDGACATHPPRRGSDDCQDRPQSRNCAGSSWRLPLLRGGGKGAYRACRTIAPDRRGGGVHGHPGCSQRHHPDVRRRRGAAWAAGRRAAHGAAQIVGRHSTGSDGERLGRS